MVWASDYPDQPADVYNTVYIPYSVDNFTNTIEWYVQHHPDWLEYLCDRKTLRLSLARRVSRPSTLPIPP